MSFLILPFAGKTSATTESFKYSHHCKQLSDSILYKVIVTTLKQRSQFAGNFIAGFFINLIKGLINESDKSTSETLRSKSKIKLISFHVPTHLKPTTDNDFGHYLAGLIDGDGHFSSAMQLVIVFHSLDASLAYYIKERLGFGNVRKVKNKKAVILVISKREGILKVLSLINGKIRSHNKLDQINKNIFSNSYYSLQNTTLAFDINVDQDLNNGWLAGFSDADGSFQIKLINKIKTEVRLNFQIDQKNKDLLLLIKNFLGGNIGFRKSKNTYYYGSTSFGSAYNVINYFDHFHLLSSKHINYLKWRKAYICIQNREHLKDLGLEKITKLKNTMNRNNLDTLD